MRKNCQSLRNLCRRQDSAGAAQSVAEGLEGYKELGSSPRPEARLLCKKPLD